MTLSCLCVGVIIPVFGIVHSTQIYRILGATSLWYLKIYLSATNLPSI